MYLARKRLNGRIRYYIRESVRQGRRIVSRDIFDLGHHPERFIVYPDGGNAFYFDPGLVDRLEAAGIEPDNESLERVFWPFLNPESRRVILKFTRPTAGEAASLTDQKRRCETESFHLFDRRRIHYLKFGALDQTGIDRVPRKIYRSLLDKSRDEIEQQFMEMERVLRRTEKKNYVYAIFDVASHFHSEIARVFPQAMNQEKVDDAFITEICRLNADTGFWSDPGIPTRLDDYLLRYAFWFFDSEFDGSTYLEDLMWQFKRRHHAYHPPPGAAMPVEEAVETMGISRGELDRMTIRTLTRQYRQRAHSVHPDKGGSHEQFIRLNRAFTDLLRRVKGTAKR